MASTGKPLSDYSPDTCMFCHQSLRVTTGATEPDVESKQVEEAEAATVIDDVELYCGRPGSGPGGHHAHWTCLIDYAQQARAPSVMPAQSPILTTCPACGENTLNESGRFIVDVRNEGGETKRFDFGEILVRSCRLSFVLCLSLARSHHRVHTRVPIGVGPTLCAEQEEEVFLDSHPSQLHIRAFHDLVAQSDYAGAIELIAEHDIDINRTYGSEGLSALQKAMFNGDTSGVEFLKSLGATI